MVYRGGWMILMLLFFFFFKRKPGKESECGLGGWEKGIRERNIEEERVRIKFCRRPKKKKKKKKKKEIWGAVSYKKQKKKTKKEK
eukprot:NODE_30760_length_411_cov_0.785211.p1 GENE.NODE_30760_length_411_cov_0.785211~~NODE_30760_length_411_cov_0.785211.p1  ORF type:complete len:85 (-),score=23.83 NODE_30760_length_411_cov_0.785211:114-368(-)